MYEQGAVQLLSDEVAQQLLASTLPARLAYVWKDGTPRVIPIWFHWTGGELVFGTPPGAPKLKALSSGDKVAVSIDSDTWPYHVLMVRGEASVEMVDGVAVEYAAAASRYMGEDQGRAWCDQLAGRFPRMARIAIRPEWVGILDFETRFPSALA